MLLSFSLFLLFWSQYSRYDTSDPSMLKMPPNFCPKHILLTRWLFDPRKLMEVVHKVEISLKNTPHLPHPSISDLGVAGCLPTHQFLMHPAILSAISSFPNTEKKYPELFTYLIIFQWLDANFKPQPPYFHTNTLIDAYFRNCLFLVNSNRLLICWSWLVADWVTAWQSNLCKY